MRLRCRTGPARAGSHGQLVLEESAQHDIGLIAQEVYDVIPEVVKVVLDIR